jgi:hypothetical protein
MTTQAYAVPTPTPVTPAKQKSFFTRPWATLAGVVLLLVVLEGQLFYSVRAGVANLGRR